MPSGTSAIKKRSVLFTSGILSLSGSWCPSYQHCSDFETGKPYYKLAETSFESYDRVYRHAVHLLFLPQNQGQQDPPSVIDCVTNYLRVVIGVKFWVTTKVHESKLITAANALNTRVPSFRLHYDRDYVGTIVRTTVTKQNAHKRRRRHLTTKA